MSKTTKNNIIEIEQVVKELLDERDYLIAVYRAAKYLRDSGYDGQFIGEVCEPLFKAIEEYERKVS